MATVFKPSAQEPALNSTRLVPAQHDHRTYFATIAYGTPADLVMAKTYWRHHVQQLRPKDVIRCFAEDGTWERWVTVIAVDNTGAVVSTLFHAKHETAEPLADGEFEVKWGGPVLQFVVVNKRTGDRVKANLYPKSQAESFLSTLKGR